MQVINNKICYLIIVLLYLISCNNNLKFDDDSKILKNIKVAVKTFDLDSVMDININLTNNSNKNVYIPVSHWFYDGKIDNNYSLFAQPDNPFLSNTIHFYPKGSNLLNGMMHMGTYENLSNFPYFYLIEKNKTKNFIIRVPKYGFELDRHVSRFKKEEIYSFLIRLSIISEYNIFKIINYNNISDINNIYNDSIIIPSKNIVKPICNLKISNVVISKKYSEYLNILASNKLDIQFDHYFH